MAHSETGLATGRQAQEVAQGDHMCSPFPFCLVKFWCSVLHFKLQACKWCARSSAPRLPEEQSRIAPQAMRVKVAAEQARQYTGYHVVQAASAWFWGVNRLALSCSSTKVSRTLVRMILMSASLPAMQARGRQACLLPMLFVPLSDPACWTAGFMQGLKLSK